MSFYIELKNWDEGCDKTFLVHSFNAASKRIEKGKGFFAEDKYGPDPERTEVKLQPGSYQRSATVVELPIGYEAFKKKMAESRALGTIPSFDTYKAI